MYILLNGCISILVGTVGMKILLHLSMMNKFMLALDFVGVSFKAKWSFATNYCLVLMIANTNKKATKSMQNFTNANLKRQRAWMP